MGFNFTVKIIDSKIYIFKYPDKDMEHNPKRSRITNKDPVMM